MSGLYIKYPARGSGSGGGGSSGANTALSNLGSTSVNAHVIPGVDQAVDLGSTTKRWNNGYIINLIGPTHTTQAGNNLTLQTGDNPTGAPGSIVIQSSVGSGGSRGSLSFSNGTASAQGYVWTAVNSLGHGAWAPAAAGGITGSVSLANQVRDALPLSQTTGSLSLSSQASGSLNLATQVSGNLSISNFNGGAGANNVTFWRGDGIWTQPIITLESQVNGVLPVANGGFGSSAASPTFSTNIGLSTIASASTYVVSVKSADGVTDPNGSNLLYLSFRSLGSTTAGYTYQFRLAPLSVVVPPLATLGLVSSYSQSMWVYAISTAGAWNDIGVCGTVLNESDVQSTVRISGSATSISTLYANSTSATASIRLMGRANFKQTTIGTWTSQPTDLTVMPQAVQASSEWVSYTPTYTSIGVVTTQNMKWRRQGNLMLLSGGFVAAGNDASEITFTMPAGFRASSNICSVSENCGVWFQDQGNGAYGTSVLCAPGSNIIYIGFQGNASEGLSLTDAHADAIIGPGARFAVTASVPVAGWNIYGP